ncbi:helix-turn-helix domain-containing protein [Paenibacillus sp. KQZ6P-2]|uniref:Helix-turn-helix domain-containing protein n=1 Tax=Paenibacillus mangrovi TaxID=2931978 RepID=A0A9X2B2P8_9BACL|nr:helix-turn-helix domain-containing protein [Paenibacillus mangrovi]MCJ8012511.1 helix-turn-helix domain-containing protein [Paenibacillus mangrovi]
MNYEVKVDVSPIYELLGSFMVYTSKKWVRNLDIGPEWISEVSSKLAPEVSAALSKAAAWPFDDYDVLYAWAIHRNNGDSVISFLECLQETPEEVLLAAASPYLPNLTLEETRRIREQYTPLLEIWYENYFKDVEAGIIPLIEEDAKEKGMLLTKMDPMSLIEYASGGLVIENVPEVQTIVLFPTVHNRPINAYCYYKKMMLVQYPVDVPEEDEDEPPTCLLRMTHALSDPKRLRLLRYVAEKPHSLDEMVRDLDQPEESLKHHLMILRVAGLLRIHLGAEEKEKFSIRPDGASELQMFLESYMRL